MFLKIVKVQQNFENIKYICKTYKNKIKYP